MHLHASSRDPPPGLPPSTLRDRLANCQPPVVPANCFLVGNLFALFFALSLDILPAVRLLRQAPANTSSEKSQTITRCAAGQKSEVHGLSGAR
jgi:hypothetical protein